MTHQLISLATLNVVEKITLSDRLIGVKVRTAERASLLTGASVALETLTAWTKQCIDLVGLDHFVGIDQGFVVGPVAWSAVVAPLAELLAPGLRVSVHACR